MKLEIELDLNKIDYDTINQQIVQKLENLNIEDHYRIADTIKRQIDEKITEVVALNMYTGYWSNNVDGNVKNAITNELKDLIRETLKPKVKEFFDALPDDQIARLVSDLMPKVFMVLLKERCEGMVYEAFNKQNHENYNHLVDEIEKIKSGYYR